MRSYLVVGLCVVLAVLCLSGLLLAQRSDRGIITGIVTDPTGSSVTGATVKVRNEGTGVETASVTNDAGAYTTPPLVLGNYSVTVDHAGFKTSVNSGIMLQGAETIRKDVALAVGSVSESVEVKAGAQQLEVTTPDVSHTVDEKYYRDIPIITAGDVRLAEAMLQIQPGYLPMKPNGDPMFRGSQFNSRINGGQTMATENFFDGAAFGYASGSPAEPGERSSGGEHPGDEGHHHDLLGSIRPYQRRIHRVHLQVRHQQGAWKCVRVLRQRCAQCARVFRRRLQFGNRPVHVAQEDSSTQQRLRLYAGRPSGHSQGLQRAQQDILLHQY